MEPILVSVAQSQKGANPSQGYPNKLLSGFYNSLPIIISLYPQEETSMGRVQCAEYPISSHIITLKSKSNLKKKTNSPSHYLKKMYREQYGAYAY